LIFGRVDAHVCATAAFLLLSLLCLLLLLLLPPPLLLLSFEPLDLEAAWRKAAGKAMLSS